MEQTTIFLKEDHEYLTLNVLLKLSGIIDTGGAAKEFLKHNIVKVNGELEQRRGRKLYPNDIVEVLDQSYIVKK